MASADHISQSEMLLKRNEHWSVRFSHCESAPVAILISKQAVPEKCRGVQDTFSTQTLFSRTLSTLTLESFHDYDQHFRPFTLTLFHDNNRPHIVCAFYCKRGIDVNSILSAEKVCRCG